VRIIDRISTSAVQIVERSMHSRTPQCNAHGAEKTKPRKKRGACDDSDIVGLASSRVSTATKPGRATEAR